MTLFEEILSESGLLTESVDGHSITKAINDMLTVTVVYHDGVDERDKKGRLTYHGKKSRTVYPLVYGRLKSGADAVAVYMNFGSSRRGYNASTNDKAVQDHGKSFKRDKPWWKLIRVDRIVSWSNTHNTFEKKADELISKGLNVDGDSRFEEIYVISPICTGYTQNQQQEPKPEQQTTSVIPQSNAQPQIAGTKPVENIPATQQIGSSPISKTTVEPTVQKTNWANQYDKEKEISLDNSGKVSYNKTNNKIEAPETKPVSKSDVANGDEVQQPNNDLGTNKKEPVSSTEENNLTTSYNNLMDRWKEANNK